jgi:iron complex outermembrane receptor protein
MTRALATDKLQGRDRILTMTRTATHSWVALISTITLTCVARADEVSSGPTSGSQLEEITVTATRREESIQKVPISVKALSQEDLDQGHVQDIADIAAITPGLQYSVPNGFGATITTIAIRGMNTQVGASVVGIYLDDTPIQSRLPAIGDVGDTFPLVFDLNRVEVERGPQGTLFGAGSEAGAVRFISNAPSLTDFSGFSHGEISSTEGGSPSGEVGAAVGGPIVEDKVGFRVSVMDRWDGGYVDRIDPLTGDIVDRNANADRKLALRGALAFQVDESVKITPSFFYQAVDVDDSSRFYGYFSDASSGDFINGALLPEAYSDKLAVPSVKLEAQLPFADLTAVASHMDRTVDLTRDLGMFYGPIAIGGFGSPIGQWYPTSPSDVMPLIYGETIRGLTEEVRLASNQPDAFVSWVAGIFNDHRTQGDYQHITSEVIDPSGAPIYYVDEQTTDDQLAVFGQADFHLNKQWTATLGERVARVRVHEVDYNGTGLFNTGEPPAAYTVDKETPNTPKAALSYQADPNNLFYASVGKGFRVGGGNAPLAASCDATIGGYKSDYVWSYEVGAKNQFLNQRLQVDSSVFYINWYNIQSIVAPPCGSSYATNAGNAVSKGFDVALQGVVTDRLRVNLDVGYVDAYYTSNVFDSAGQQLVVKGDAIGLLPQVNPPWDVNTSANYVVPLVQGDKIHLRGEFQYHSRNPGPFITQIPGSLNYFPLIVPDPPTHLFNARLGYTRHKFDVTLFVENAFNSHPLLSAFQGPATSNLLTYNTFRPRTVGLAIDYGF